MDEVKPARAEALDEGAAGDLKPCPFCGGEAEIIHLDDGDNEGGSCVCCTKCQASGNVEFGRKENFVENWNRRAHPSPTPAADADRVREAVDQTPSSAWIDCVQKMLERFDRAKGKGGYPTANEREAMRRCMIPVHLLSALKSTAAKEGEASG